MSRGNGVDYCSHRFSRIIPTPTPEPTTTETSGEGSPTESYGGGSSTETSGYKTQTQTSGVESPTQTTGDETETQGSNQTQTNPNDISKSQGVERPSDSPNIADSNPPNVYEENKGAIWGGIVAFILLVAIVVIIVVLLTRRNLSAFDYAPDEEPIDGHDVNTLESALN